MTGHVKTLRETGAGDTRFPAHVDHLGLDQLDPGFLVVSNLAPAAGPGTQKWYQKSRSGASAGTMFDTKRR